jgi:protein TonB
MSHLAGLVPPPYPTPADGSAVVSSGVMEGLLLSKVDPVYPLVARAGRISGVVTMHAMISKQGDVTGIEIISGPELLRSAAIDAVSKWKFKPYMVRGMPTTVDTTIVVNFSLGAATKTTGSTRPTNRN